MAKSAIRQSFLDDTYNLFPIEGAQWLFKRIFQEPRLKQRFVQSEDPVQWRQQAIEQFKHYLVHVQELLLFCYYFTGGPPSRGPEILSVRHQNTRNSGLRNIRVKNRLMFFAPQTYKNYIQRGKEKVVYYYLPQEVGELLMYYLWLVLLFQEKVQISVDKEVQFSLFL